MANCMNTETDQILIRVRQRTREDIGGLNPLCGVDSCFKLGRLHIQPRSIEITSWKMRAYDLYSRVE